jgi:hypothetical protein
MAKLTFTALLLMLFIGVQSAFGAQDNSDWITYEAPQSKAKEPASDDGEARNNKNKAKQASKRTPSDVIRQNSVSKRTNTSKQPINLNRAYLGYVRASADGVDGNGAELGFTSAFGRNQNWLVGLSGGSVAIDDAPVSSDFASINFGHASYVGNTAITGTIGLGKNKVNVCFGNYCFSESSSVLVTDTAFIHKISDSLEITGGVSITSLLDSDPDTEETYTFSLGTNYFFSPNFGISLDAARNSDDGTAVGLGFIYRY